MDSAPRKLTDIRASAPPPAAPPPRPTPLLPVAVGFILGIVCDYYLALPTALAASMAFAFAALAMFLSHGAQPSNGAQPPSAVSRQRRLAGVALLIASAAVGAMRHDLAFRRLPDNHVARFARDEPVLVHIQGRVVGGPEIVEPDPSVPRAFEQGPRTKFILECEEIGGREGPIPVQGKIASAVKAPVVRLKIGDRVAMTGWLYRPPSPRNPGDYDWALAQRRAGLWVGFSCDHAESVRFVDGTVAQASRLWLGHDIGGWRGWLARMRTRMSGYLLYNAFNEGESGAGVMEAVVLGQRGAVPKAMNEAFVRTGNAHFLAASGMNVAWLALLGWGVMRLIGVYYRVSVVVIALLIITYVLLAEPEPSILRAGVVGLLGCLCIFLRGRASVLNWLACSAVVVLMIDPCDVFRAGFQLSFIAVLAVMDVSKVVREMYPRWGFLGVAFVGLDEFVGSLGHSALFPVVIEARDDSRAMLALRWTLRASLLCVSVSIACVITTAPLSCYTFNQLAPWGLIGTFVLWFPAFFATFVGYIKVVLGLFFPSSAIVMGPLLSVATSLMVGTVDVLSKLPYTLIDGRSPSLAWVLFAHLIIAWRTYHPQRCVFPHRFKLAAVVIAAWWLIPPRWMTHDPKAVEVWMVAVGDGSANVIELPDGKVYVCDFGTRSPFDAGNVAINFLRHRGIRRIDACFVSHADFDHFSGIERLVREMPVGRVVLNDQFEPFVREKSAPWYFLRAMREQGIPIEVTHGPTRFFDSGGVMVESIWPPAYDQTPLRQDNDGSTVLRVSYEGRSVLLPGDIADQAMAGLLERGSLKADVLALPHHGSVVGSTRRFIEAVSPEMCVRSTAQRRGMTTNGIEALVGNRRYLCTADDGCVRVRISSGRVSADAVMKPARRAD